MDHENVIQDNYKNIEIAKYNDTKAEKHIENINANLYHVPNNNNEDDLVSAQTNNKKVLILDENNNAINDYEVEHHMNNNNEQVIEIKPNNK